MMEKVFRASSQKAVQNSEILLLRNCQPAAAAAWLPMKLAAKMESSQGRNLGIAHGNINLLRDECTVKTTILL